MRIIVFSDSHRNVLPMKKVLDSIGRDMDCLIHLGDVADDANVLARAYPELQQYVVRGNCDYSGLFPEEKLITIRNKKIYITHGHSYGVKHDFGRVFYAAKENKADICLFGHTHVPVTFRHEGIYFMNPGSISLPRPDSFPSYGIININDMGRLETVVVGCIDNHYRPIDVEINFRKEEV